MKISVLSDLHLDYFFGEEIPSQKEVISVFSKVFNEKADVLICAGDIGHSNRQNAAVLFYLKNIFFDRVVTVLGNHDYYLFPTDEEPFYDSIERVEAMKETLGNVNGVDCLDGTIIDIDGVKIGGACGWYDGNYLRRNFKPPFPASDFSDSYINALWKQSVNDYFYTSGIDTFDQIWHTERIKIDRIVKESNIAVTHVPPYVTPSLFSKEFSHMESTAFFSFDGEKMIEENDIKFWVHGHTHTNVDFEMFNTRIVAHHLGRPKKLSEFKEKIICINE